MKTISTDPKLPIVEIIVGTGKQLKFGNFKAHCSMTLQIPQDTDQLTRERLVSHAYTWCDIYVRQSLQQQIEVEQQNKPPVEEKNALDNDEVKF